MRTIALEEHMTTPGIVKAAQMSMHGASPAFLQSIGSKLLDVGDGRIADMDAAGIDMQVLSVSANTLDKLDSATANALARDANDQMAAAVRAHPDRFAAFATLALQEADQAATELDRSVRQLGFKGVMLNGTRQRSISRPSAIHADLRGCGSARRPDLPAPRASAQAGDGRLLQRPHQQHAGFLLSTAGWGWHVETGMHACG